MIEAAMLLQRAFTAIGVPLADDYVIDPTGWPRALLGLYSALPGESSTDLREEIAAWLVTVPAVELLRMPQLNVSPLHNVAALNPSPTLKNLVGDMVHRQEVVFLQEHEWSPVHRQMLGATLQLVKATCVANGVDGRKKIGDSTLLARLAAQIRHLHADKFLFIDTEPVPRERLATTGDTISPEFSRLRLGALRWLAKTEPQLWRNIHGTWWHPTISRRDARNESPQARALRGEESTVRDRQYLFAMRLKELEAEEGRFDLETEEAVRPYEANALSWLPQPGNLGRAAWLRILDKCAEDPSPEAATVQFTICAARRISSLAADKISFTRSCALVRGIITPPAENSVRNGELHYTASGEFTSFAPIKCSRTVQNLLRENSGLKIEERANEWLQSIAPRATYASLVTCLKFQVPLWHGLDPIYFEFGLNPHPAGRPAWCHYVSWRPETGMGPLRDFIQSYFDPRFGVGNYASGGCGSAFLPKLTVVRQLVRAYRALLETPKSDDHRVTLDRINAVVACARILEGLFTFTRARDAFAPTMVSPIETWRLVQEKGCPRIVYFPAVWRTEARKLYVALTQMEEVIASAGLTISGSVGRGAFWFLEPSGDTMLTALHRIRPTRVGVHKHLRGHPRTLRYAELDPHAMRCFSNFWLRQPPSGLSHATVLALHDHSASRTRSQLSWDVLRRPVLEAEHEHAANHLARLIELV
jgi:hypothetical protein